ncbi:uncharacterized protein MYCFIDRAFT_176346 [Pseudocercospora fijiensis CIRAD86]|uniref:Uncharacterized protein n=1 Tax=Pseudocercospora fijiensis (strain CIRAD86) TaxID=383855 RepID=M3AV08_PSEFD|nr:uncharacterized protein MYCFIDRAFT_176346 [Pseudocercospora fijiensis CIRAD86]EME80998.1 hypothetical protein MYCFIDRAFT_176346 [Pseudocercospora fijiensis CIRAD86]
MQAYKAGRLNGGSTRGRPPPARGVEVAPRSNGASAFGSDAMRYVGVRISSPKTISKWRREVWLGCNVMCPLHPDSRCIAERGFD